MNQWRSRPAPTNHGPFVKPEPWMLKAACQGHDPDLWFPARGQAATEAKTICASCPVQQRCLDYALEHVETHGIWGGLSERARRRIRAQNRRAS